MLINPVAATPNATSAPLAATPLTAAQANWAAPDGGVSGGVGANYNYNPQNQINSSNAQYLGITWLFPVPGHPQALATLTGAEGFGTQPLVINGVLYDATQDDQVYALNAANGNVIWNKIIPISTIATAELLKLAPNGQPLIQTHFHPGSLAFTTKLFGGTPTFWVQAADRRIYAFKASDGSYEMNFSYFGGPTSHEQGTADPAVHGSNPSTIYARLSTGMIIDDARGILISSMLSSSSNIAARCFYTAWNVNVNPPTRMWVTYCSPPQNGSDTPLNPNWDMQQVNSMIGAQIFYPGPTYNGGGTIPGTGVVDLKTLSPAVLNSTLYNDWGQSNQNAFCLASDGGGSPGGTGSGWGGPWIVGVGATSGIAFVNTGNRGPYTSPCTPGPDLWSSAMMALNETTGNWIWGFQAIAHDELDYDCSWNQALGNETVNGANVPVIWKTCKSGYLFELNALTGKMIWAWEPEQNVGPRCPVCFPHDPMNVSQMTEGWIGHSTLTTYANAWSTPYTDTLAYPVTAGVEADFAYSPATNYIYVASESTPSLEHYVPLNSTNYGGTNGFSGIATAGTGSAYNNATIWGINALTGQDVWHHTFLTASYRGGVSTSGNVVYMALVSGDLMMLNAQTGAIIKDLFLGGATQVTPSIGATASGTVEVFVSVNPGGTTVSVPGDLIALSLQNLPTTVPASTTTATTTATSTITVGGATSTVTAPGSVTTVTSTSSGTSSTTLYGVAAVAVIFIIATGYLAMRGRKPAS